MWVSGLWRAFCVLGISSPVTRPPQFPPRSDPGRESDGLEQLEELGDDAIISQQTAAHVPRPRAKISDEPRSVVISEHAQRRDTEPPKPAKSRNEATVVIRDRRALDQLRAQYAREGQRRAKQRRAMYWWGALGLVAFLLGGAVAFVATAPDEPSGSDAPAPAKVEPARAVPAPRKPEASATPAPRQVTLDQLPVERPKH